MNEEIFKQVKEKYRKSDYVYLDEDESSIRIYIQNGPIKESGVNGVQIDELGKIWLEFLKYFNSKLPSRENSIAITKIEEALMWQQKRAENREKRGVEGLNKP